MAWAGKEGRGRQEPSPKTDEGLRASRVGEELAEVGPSAAKASRPDATLEERLSEGQLSRKGQERRPQSNEGGSRGGAEGKGDFTRLSTSEEADEGRCLLPPPATDLKGEDNEAAPVGPEELRVGAVLPQAAPRHECAHHAGVAGRPNPGGTRKLCQQRAGRRPTAGDRWQRRLVVLYT